MNCHDEFAAFQICMFLATYNALHHIDIIVSVNRNVSNAVV